MKRIIAILLITAMITVLLASCDNNDKPKDTTAPDTTQINEPQLRESKAYPNSLTVSAYTMLTNSEKTAYEAIAKLISSPEPSKSITLKQSVRLDSFNMIMDIFKGNFATHSAVLENISYTETDGNITAVMISDSFDAEGFTKEYEAINEKADEIIRSIPLGLSDKEIVFEIVDYLTSTIEVLDDSETTTVYNTLIDGKADSEGYAKAFDLLLKKAGIPSFTVYGYDEEYVYDNATSSGHITYSFPEPRHYWNYLCLWSKWYEIDLSRLHPVWFDAGELFLNMDELMRGNDRAYYFYRNSMDKMQTPLTEQWQNSMNSYELSDDIIELLENTNLEAIAKESYDYALKVKFKNITETEKFLKNNRKNIKDKTGTEYTLYLRKEAGEETIINITPVKVMDFDSLSYSTESYKFSFCFKYNENVDLRDQEILTYFEPITINIDIPEHWSGEEGRYFKYSANSDYPGYTNSMSIMRLTNIPSDFVLDESHSRVLAGGELYMSEYYHGTTSNGYKYCYYLQKEPRGIDGYYTVFIQLSEEYVFQLYITEELANEDIVMKVIDSVSLLEMP